jgi:hypothetical protein
LRAEGGQQSVPSPFCRENGSVQRLIRNRNCKRFYVREQVVKRDLTDASKNSHLDQPGCGQPMQLAYLALFAILVLNGLVVLLALSHAMNNRD